MPGSLPPSSGSGVLPIPTPDRSQRIARTWRVDSPGVSEKTARYFRRIRERFPGVLLVPALRGAFWFAAFDGSALYYEIFQQRGIAEAVKTDVTSALFVTLEQFPAGSWACWRPC